MESHPILTPLRTQYKVVLIKQCLENVTVVKINLPLPAQKTGKKSEILWNSGQAEYKIKQNTKHLQKDVRSATLSGPQCCFWNDYMGTEADNRAAHQVNTVKKRRTQPSHLDAEFA